MTVEESMEVSKVTTDKPKNPGRQEWGRKLGKMQKELKAKKLDEGTLDQTSNNSYLKWEYVVAAIGLVIGFGAFYYQKKSYEVQVRPVSTVPVETSKREVRFSDF